MVRFLGNERSYHILCMLRFYDKIKFQLKLIDKMSDFGAIAK